MIAWLLMILMSIVALPIVPDEPLTVVLDGQTPVYYRFSAEAGQAVTIALLQADDDAPLNNPVLALIHDGRLLVYNNDAHPDTKDARIADYILPATGEYWIFADTYGGIYAGDLTLTLSFVDPFRAEVAQNAFATVINVHLPTSQTYRYQTTFQAGDQVNIASQSRSDGLDLMVWLYDESGELLVFNDDHGTDDDVLGDLDAQIRDFVIPSDGTFEIVVSDLLGLSGEFALVIQRDA